MAVIGLIRQHWNTFKFPVDQILTHRMTPKFQTALRFKGCHLKKCVIYTVFLAETIRIIYEKGFEHDCVITSQSYDTLCKVKELAPEIQTGYILALGVGSYYDLPAADFFSVESTFITPGMVQQIHLRGKTISAWTVNRQEDASDLLSLGVDDIITDKPEMVQQLMNADADLDNDLLLIRDTIRSLIGWFDAGDEPTPEEEVIEEAIEDPEELLDAA